MNQAVSSVAACLFSCLPLLFPIKREFFLPPVAKTFAQRGHMIVGVSAVFFVLL